MISLGNPRRHAGHFSSASFDRMTKPRLGIFRKTLLASVAALPLVIASGARDHVHAQDWDYFIIGEGRFLTSSGDGITWAENDNTGQSYAQDFDDGWAGRLGVGLTNGPWDFGLFASHMDGKDSSGATGFDSDDIYNVFATTSIYYDLGEVTTNQDLMVVDFEIGRDLGIGGNPDVKVRVFGGVRWAEFNQNASTFFDWNSSTLREQRSSGFQGFGPRIGTSVSVPLHQTFFLDVSGSAAVLWGKTRVHVDWVGDSSAFWSETQTVYNLEGEIGLSTMTDWAKFTAGIRGEAWYNVADTTNGVSVLGNSYGTSSADQYFWGPFVRMKVIASGTRDGAIAQDWGYFIVGEGRYLNSGGDDITWAENDGTGQSYAQDFDGGWAGRFGLGLTNGPWDFGLFASHMDGKDSSGATGFDNDDIFNVLATTSSFYDLGEVTTNQDLTVVDFEIGRDLGIGGNPDVKVRVFGGVRWAEFNQNASTFFDYNLGAFILQEQRLSGFQGFGPRIGTSVSVPLHQTFFLDVSGSAAALLGKTRVNVDWAGAADSSEFWSETQTVFNLEGEIGLSTMTDWAKFTAGIRGEAWYNVADTTNFSSRFGNSYGTSSADQYFWGPFVRMKVNFGG